jgi:catechol 2,3-dioxygenase-like lactoylglutathione lyase family enzyme
LRKDVILKLRRPKEAHSEPAFSLLPADGPRTCREAREKGVAVTEIKRKDHLVYFLHDPDGILIEIKDE